MERSIAVIVALSLHGACGSVSSQESDAAGGPDAGDPDAGDLLDAPPARCDPSAPFGMPVPVAEINSAASDQGARLTPDELTVYFTSQRAGGVGGFDLYAATRESRDEPFDAPALLENVNTTGFDLDPSPTGDDLTLYALAPDNVISRATRGSTAEPFGPLAAVAELDSPDTEGEPFVVPDHSAIYFHRTTAAGDIDMVRAARAADGSFDTPIPLEGAGINTAGDEVFPVVTPDELTLFFGAVRPGDQGQRDVYMATRSSTAEPFGDVIVVPEVSTPNSDVPSWVSADGCVLYITFDVAGGERNILIATRGQ